MSLSQLIGALCAHRYLFAFVLLAAYARRLTAPDSRCPLTLPTAWRPVVSTLAGLGYGVLAAVQGGASWGSAALGGVIAAAAGGFGDMLLVAIFTSSDRAPAWARALAFVFDDLKGDTTPPGPRNPAAPSSGGQGTANGPSLRRTSAIAGAALLAGLGLGCSKPLPPQVPSDLANDYACVVGDLSRGVTSFAQIEAECSPGQINTVVDIVDWILAHPERARDFAPIVPGLQVELRATRARAAR